MKKNIFKVLFLLFFLKVYIFSFEKIDLSRMEKKLLFFNKGPYTISISRIIKEPEEIQKKTKYITLDFYYISKNWYDRIFSIEIKLPVEIKEEDNALVLKPSNVEEGDVKIKENIKITESFIEINKEYKFNKEKDGFIFSYLSLDAIRFDDSICFRKQNNGIIVQKLIKPYSIKTINEVFDKNKIEKLFNSEDIKPDYIIKTEEGLWTLWEFNLKTENIGKLYDFKNTSLIIPSSEIRPVFYNTAREIKEGGEIKFSVKLKVIPDESFPIPLKKSSKTTLFDSHIHITVLTDLRDTVLMARKNGYKYGLLSIYYDEGTYKRLFLGNEDMFILMKKYPDVFIGFGLLQLNENGYPGFPRKGPDTPEHIEQLWKNGCKGIKILEKWSGVDVSDPKFDSIYKKISELKMPVVFHTEPEKGPTMERVIKVAEKFPEIPVIAAHFYGEKELEITINGLKKISNFYIQHMHLGKFLKRFVEEGVIHKVIFGTDLQDDHSGLISSQYKFVQELKSLGVDEETIEKIMYKTMEEIIGKVKGIER